MKLTSAQQRVVDLMLDGWVLHRFMPCERNGPLSRAFISNKASEIKPVHWATFVSLFKLNLLKETRRTVSGEKYTLNKRRLTEQWKGTNGDK